MKTKGKEKAKKDEKKRSEEKKVISGTPTHRVKALPLGHVKQRRCVEILLLKPSSLQALLNVNSKIFFRRMTAVSTVKTQRRCISSHLHVNNGSPTA